MTLGINSLQQHPILCQLPEGLSYSINTDDPFVFAITLSDELHLVSSLFSWNLHDYLQYLKSVKEQILDKSSATREFIEGTIRRTEERCWHFYYNTHFSSFRSFQLISDC